MNIAIDSESSNVSGIEARRRTRIVSRRSAGGAHVFFINHRYHSSREGHEIIKRCLRARVQQYFPVLVSVVFPLLLCPLFMHHLKSRLAFPPHSLSLSISPSLSLLSLLYFTRAAEIPVLTRVPFISIGE